MNFLIEQEAKASFHTPEEIAAFKNPVMGGPLVPGEYFLHSSHCEGCHGFDSAHVANIDESGNSVNLFDHWQTSMMANSARDPLWRAKVSHEILVNPAHAVELQDKCTSCHAPMGKYTSLFHGTAHYGLSNLAVDSLGQDGVSCEGCHTIGLSAGQTFSGIIPYDTSHSVYGPFENPFVGPMQLYEGLTPVFSEHMNRSTICASCHTLITDAVDTNGIPTGGVFIEQATYHEYLNSQFPADNITCQTCHMPQLDDPIIIANGFSNLVPRYPFNQHTFAGANSFMITMIKNNKASLGVDAEDWQFDSSIIATNRLLREQSIVFDLQFDSLSSNIIFFTARIENKTGHKFPSGYPSRRAVVQVIVTDVSGDTVFKSGTFTNDARVVGETPGFEPHHDVINQSGVPQIYEYVMGDVNGNFTSVLERGAIILKDNRVPPLGFTTSSVVYDTVRISNDALADPDFNKVSSTEGSGVDLVHYQVPVSAFMGAVTVHANVFYQSVPPKWVDAMFAFNSPEIDTFRIMFNNADQTPLLIASDSLMNVDLAVTDHSIPGNDLAVYPTISVDGKVFIKAGQGEHIKNVDVYSADGKKVNILFNSEKNSILSVSLPSGQTVYLMKIQTEHRVFYRKVIRQ